MRAAEVNSGTWNSETVPSDLSAVVDLAPTGPHMIVLGLRITVTVAAVWVLLTWTTGHRARAEERPVKIVALGDSLTAGYGIPAFDAFPAKLEHALRNEGQRAVVANAGVSGDTAAMGLARLDRSIPADTDAEILELGANVM